jgi:hypothetical protein
MLDSDHLSTSNTNSDTIKMKLKINKDNSTSSTNNNNTSNESLNIDNEENEGNNCAVQNNENKCFTLKNSKLFNKRLSKLNMNQTSSAKDESKTDENYDNLKKNETFVKNLKLFLKHKLKINKNDFPNAIATSSPTILKNRSENFSSASLETKSEHNYNNSSSTRLDSIETYQKIIDTHRGLLPENFTLRQFPYSSCQDTFCQDIEDKSKLKTASKRLDLPSISPSLSPSPQSQASPSSKSSPNSIECPQNSNQKSVVFKLGGDSGSHHRETNAINLTNKRFYHVFKKNELDSLIRDYCPELTIYDSYYDHGNWCICAKKKLLTE